MKEYNEQVVETLDDAGCIIANKNIIIDNFQARIAELEEENARLKETLVDHGEIQKSLCENLSASQAYAEQLREAIAKAKEGLVQWHVPENRYESLDAINAALALPRDTSALDAYVSEKVKAKDLLIEVMGKQVQEFSGLLNMKIATLTRQRDLAVGAASDAATSLETIQLRSFGEESYLDSKPQMRAFAGARAKIARDIISTIKESEAMAQGEK